MHTTIPSPPRLKTRFINPIPGTPQPHRQTPIPATCRALALAALPALALGLLSGTARGQIFVNDAGGVGEFNLDGSALNPAFISGPSAPQGIAVSGNNLFVVYDWAGKIGQYTTSGATVNASLISGLARGSEGIVVSQDRIFVPNYHAGTVGEYTTSGATVNASLISGLSQPVGIALSGDTLFVANSEATGPQTIGEYTTSGAVLNASLISGLHSPTALAVSGDRLFVANFAAGTIGEYTTSGATLNASLITGLVHPNGLAISGEDLFVLDAGTGEVGEYTTTGATVNAALFSVGSGADLGYEPFGLVVVPEPAAGALTLFGAGLWLLGLWKRHRPSAAASTPGEAAGRLEPAD